jgi:hypothetical protein
MTTQFCSKNPNLSPLKNWISVGKHLEIRRRNMPYYGDLYAYAANNPVRYVDPDGRIVKLKWSSDEEKNMLLKVINNVSKYKYDVSADGSLYRVGDRTNGFFGHGRSQKISAALDDAISLTDKTITIEFSEMLINYSNGNILVEDICTQSNGGVTTEMNGEIQIHLSKRGGVLIKYADGSMHTPKTVEELFIHEFYGHAYPIAKGVNGNAVEKENEIREELKMKKRMEESGHVCFVEK